MNSNKNKIDLGLILHCMCPIIDWSQKGKNIIQFYATVKVAEMCPVLHYCQIVRHGSNFALLLTY